MREERIINRVRSIIEDYTFDLPFAVYLNHFFKSHPEMGSSDRRQTRDLCFTFFRIGRILNDSDFEKRFALSCYLCGLPESSVIQYLMDTNVEIKNLLPKKETEERVLEAVRQLPSFKLEDIFPSYKRLSNEIDKSHWYLSFLQKPKLWIRIRKTKIEKVLKEFILKNIQFSYCDSPEILSLENGVNLEHTESWKMGHFEIQDFNSQHTLDDIQPSDEECWWDACSGSGGKSLLLQDRHPSLKIFATDSRTSILNNYRKRMLKAGIQNFVAQVADLSLTNCFQENMFDGIVADVPCSGSGTWSRSPEWISRPVIEEMDHRFVPLQRKIIQNIYPSLKPGKPLIYITCSVFSQENEENVKYFTENFPLNLEISRYLKGYETFADTLFVARFTRIS